LDVPVFLRNFLICCSFAAALAANQVQALAKDSLWTVAQTLTGDSPQSMLGSRLEFTVDHSLVPKAFVHYSKSENSINIHVTDALLTLADNSDELAFVIAHELSHVALGDTLNPAGLLNSHLISEKLADAAAIKLMADVHLNAAAGSHVLAKIDAFWTKRGIDTEKLYPTLRKRIDTLKAALEK
jgi:Zn-dependent protease with chaperone function